jgi:3-hydroxyacyl-CoA dehydrogenase
VIAMREIRRAAVLGAGTMGAQIAAHLANAGVPTTLLDVTPRAAADGLARARALKPDPFFTPAGPSLIRTGGIDEDAAALADCDWIVEAVVEQIAPKRALFERVERHRRADAIVSSNTSGIPIAALAEGRSEGFRRHFLGTHFFNPPRYLYLVEVIPTDDTDPAILERMSRLLDRRLGKGVVVAKDTPGFIANHIGLFGMMQIFRALETGEYTIEEIDAITGPAIGRPSSATFRTMDVVGLDVFAHVVKDLGERLDGPARESFRLPAVVEALVSRGATGAKAGRGFYRKEPTGEISTLDLSTLEYRPKAKVRLPALDAAQAIADVGERARSLFLGSDTVGRFLRATLGPTLAYAAEVQPRISTSPSDVDRAMRWGFGWELGPFEMLRAIGAEALRDAVGPGNAPDLTPFESAAPAVTTVLQSARNRSRIVKSNPGASLVDLGDGVLALEFHSKMNSIGGDTIAMIAAGVKEAAANFAALVVGNDGANFSAGANLMLLLFEAQEGNWDEVDLMVRAFQGATMSLKHAEVPVVVAPAGLALGGGCEIALHGSAVQAAAESYVGLVEVGVGLLPGGGGTKEMLARAMDAASPGADPLPYARAVFETIGFGKVSTSAPDAVRLGYLRPSDGISMNRHRTIADAKARALALAASYVPPQPRAAIRVGGENVLAALKLGVHLAWRAGRISEYDAIIGRKLAGVLAGGNLPGNSTLSEQQLLDLEREAFLSLCGERRTHERIVHTLKTGKPLRN